MPKKKKNPKLSVKPVFKIFCEGLKTEPLYVRPYIDHFFSGRRDIRVEDVNKNTPVQLVDHAVDQKKCGTDGDIVWVVFDRESVSKYPHNLHAQARKKAKDNQVEIAFSNVCFELWILLHFTFSSASYNSCCDLIKRSDLIDHLKSVGIEYNCDDKTSPFIFDRIKSLIPEAKKNARRLKEYAEATAEVGRSAPYYTNPYTDMHEMFEDMQKFVDGEPSIRT